MPAPKTAKEARQWAQDAMAAGRYRPAVHFAQRMAERGINMFDVRAAIEGCGKVEPYERAPVHGGTCWRVLGPDVDRERTIAVGIEAYQDERTQRYMILCTVFEET